MLADLRWIAVDHNTGKTFSECQSDNTNDAMIGSGNVVKDTKGRMTAKERGLRELIDHDRSEARRAVTDLVADARRGKGSEYRLVRVRSFW